MTEFKVPELGENVTTGDVLRVLVNVGDTIGKEQPIVELETDKATVEVPSSVAGVVKRGMVPPGRAPRRGGGHSRMSRLSPMTATPRTASRSVCHNHRTSRRRDGLAAWNASQR